jgi:YD repeat-containing protein
VYVYENTTDRLKTVTDPKGQITTSTYNLDDTLASVVFTNASIATPSVSYAYDTVFNRRVSMTDGTGTTTFDYHPSGVLGGGQVVSVDGPMSSDVIVYGYDELGRTTSRSINSVANTHGYDALGRIVAQNSPLGAVTYGYDGATPRVTSVVYPNGQTTAYAYFNNAGDRRLQTIHHKYAGGVTLSRFDYTFDVVGNILTRQQEADSDPASVWTYAYDAANQLSTARRATTAAPIALTRYGYDYDKAGNRTSEQIDDAPRASSYDPLNRLI